MTEPGSRLGVAALHALGADERRSGARGSASKTLDGSVSC